MGRNNVAQRVGEGVEQFHRVFPVQFGNLRQGEQELAIIGQPRGQLEGEAADDPRRFAGSPVVLRSLPLAHDITFG